MDNEVPAARCSETAIPAEVELTIQNLAQRLLPRTVEIAAQVTERLIRDMPEVLPPSTPEAFEAVRESDEQNVGAVLSMLAFSTKLAAVEAPTGTLKILRALATAKVDLIVVLRGYWHAQSYTWDAWAAFVHDQGLPPDILEGVLRHSYRRIFQYWENGASTSVALHRQEFPALSGGYSRSRLIEDLLAGNVIDVPRARRELGYDLNARHLALVLAPLHERSDATAAAEVISTFDAQFPVLLQPQSDGSIWLWLSCSQALTSDTLQRIEALRLDNVLAGMGEPAAGVEGFRRSHGQAEQALRVARLRSVPTARTVRYREVEQLVLLTADPVRAREFCQRRLGVLGERAEAAARVRATLRVYLDNDCNKSRVAELMGIHQKTVAYRLAAAEQMLGHSIGGAGKDLAAALLIDLALHGE